jgi:putative acetyltransferase
MTIIRPYDESDLEALALLFTDSVHGLAAAHYDEVQLKAWAPSLPDLDAWTLRLASVSTLVAEVGPTRAGFISYEKNGHIDLLYTSPAYCRRGIASALYRHAETMLISHGTTEICTEASIAARPFFERQGFRVAEEQCVQLRGVMFRRFGMRKSLNAGHL